MEVGAPLEEGEEVMDFDASDYALLTNSNNNNNNNNSGSSGGGDGAIDAIPIDSNMTDVLLVREAVEFAISNGLVKPQSSTVPHVVSHVPFSLVPSPFPRHCFDLARALATDMNLLVDAVSEDAAFLQDVLGSAETVDEFTSRLMDIWRTVRSEGISQQLRLGLHRSDFMLHQPSSSSSAGGDDHDDNDNAGAKIQLVEINTISSAYAHLSTSMNRLHHHVVWLLNSHRQNQRDTVVNVGEDLPISESQKEFPVALGKAHFLYCAQDRGAIPLTYDSHEGGGTLAVVMMVVQPGECNTADQRGIEYALATNSVRLIRRTLLDVYERGQLVDIPPEEDNNPPPRKSSSSSSSSSPSSSSSSPHKIPSKRLVIDGVVVSVAYFRAGYTPDDYQSQKEWDARLTIERSHAIKCPTIAYHLTGAKKVQQALAQPGVVERFFGLKDDGSDADTDITVDVEAAQSETAAKKQIEEAAAVKKRSARARMAVRRIRSVEAGLYALEGPGADEIIAKAIESPIDYVLKPQREGGGNNLYGDDLKEKLNNLQDSERGAFILMTRICPRPFHGKLVRNGQICATLCSSELGVYSTFLGNGKELYLNKYAGHLLRTKAAIHEDGGVSSGVAVLDSPALTSV